MGEQPQDASNIIKSLQEQIGGLSLVIARSDDTIVRQNEYIKTLENELENYRNKEIEDMNESTNAE